MKVNPVGFAVAMSLLLLPAVAAAQERSLHWKELAVRARLDAEGVLHIEERQVMVFTGDWNGGERRFDLRLGQDVELLRLSRIDSASGEARALVEGDLSGVDQYAWEGDNTLRWRSRLSSDPPFEETVIPYVLDYTLSGVLEERGGLYRLNHDFAFADRSGEIERFSLDFALDPLWRPTAGLPPHMERQHLFPGENVIVTADLGYQGAVGERPADVRAVTPAPLRAAIFAASLLAMAVLYVSFRRREASLGRYSPPPIPNQWDEAWLRENLFLYLPEEVGALWDRAVGAPEVSAVLARLVGEGKLASEVRPRRSFLGRDVLSLKMKVDRGVFYGYERKLIDKLFFSGRTETDTEAVRERYQKTGFNPTALIADDLEKKLRTHAELRDGSRLGGWKRTALLVLGVLALFGLDCLGGWAPSLVLAAIVIFAVTWLYVPGLIVAFAWRKRTEHLDAASLAFLVPGLAILAVCALATFFNDWFSIRFIARPELFGDLALALLPVAAWSSLLNNARAREGESAIRRRQILGGARRLLRRELKEREPHLLDEWLPYLLAFGLQRDVDRWFRAFGGARSGGGFSTSPSSAASVGGSSSGGWTGGGGAFGGAGSSASWAAAAGGLAAGVSAPSSSGSGGGGGGGGSSSGGGGGGGW